MDRAVGPVKRAARVVQETGDSHCCVHDRMVVLIPATRGRHAPHTGIAGSSHLPRRVCHLELGCSRVGTLQINAIRLCSWLTVACFCMPSSVFAFSAPNIYGEPAATGGGAGRYFTGSPADGYGCAACHTGPGSLPVRVTGIPAEGYVPGREYAVHLAWPDAMVRANAAIAANLRPSMTIVAEFVAEDGSDSGRIDIQPMFASPGEFCTDTDPAAPKTLAALAAQLYETDPTNVEAPPKTVTSCSGGVENRRCVIATRSCGSSELRIRWTAPQKWRGPIWFSAGFVMTDDASGVPNDLDFVTEISAPMNAASIGEAYETALEAGCTAAPGRRSGTHGWLGFGALLSTLALLRRRRTGSIVLAWCLVLCAGCESDLRRPTGGTSEKVGLFTPGYRARASDLPVMAADGGTSGSGGSPGTVASCTGTDFLVEKDDAGPAPSCMMTVDLTTDARTGEFDVMSGARVNYGAVWIEDETGKYVKGLGLWRGLYFWQLRTYAIAKNRLACIEPDVMASATLRGHVQQKFMWNGKNTKGDVVPDGNYLLWVEVQVDEDRLEPAIYPFVKGRVPWTTTMPPSSPPQSALTLTYQPLD